MSATWAYGDAYRGCTYNPACRTTAPHRGIVAPAASGDVRDDSGRESVGFTRSYPASKE